MIHFFSTQKLFSPLYVVPTLLLFFLPHSLHAAQPNKVGATYTQAPSTSGNLLSVTTIPEFERYDSSRRWDTVRASDLLKELKNFKGIKGSPVLRAVWGDVLLSDFSGLSANAAEQTDLTAQRLHILNRLGFFDEAIRLYQQAALRHPIPEKIVREAIDSFALSGSADGACLEVTMAAKYLATDNWTQDAALCARYFGEQDRAQELYDKISDKAGEGFGAVYQMLADGSGGAIKAEIPPLWRTLLLAKGATLTGEALRKADGMELAAIAENPHVPLGVRLAAASRGADLGTVGWDRLRKLYETKHGDESVVPTVAAGIDADVGQPQSDLYAAARFTFEGAARARVVQSALEALHPHTNMKSHVYGWIVDKLTLQPERITWFAPHGYGLMMLTGRSDSAKIYYDTAHLETSTVAAVQALEEGKPWPQAAQTAWKEAMTQRFGNGAAKRINLVMNLLKAYDTDKKMALADSKASRNDSSSNSLTYLKESVQRGGRGLTLVAGLNHLAKAPQMNRIPSDELSEMAKVFAQQGLFGPRKKITLEILIQSVL